MPAIWTKPIDLQLLQKRSEKTLCEHLNITFTDFSDDSITANMPVDWRVKQPLGIMHGGASCVLAETLGSTAANFCVDQEKKVCVGLDINTSHIRKVTQGLVTAIAKPHHLGRSTQVWQIKIKDEQNRLISITRLTMAVIDKP
jgi:1,4-dihydroxy-2-naphthoyl-CoA hydrolase